MTYAGSAIFSDEGDGPLVVCLPGVGIGPQVYGALSVCLKEDHRVVVLRRPSATRAADIPAQAAAVGRLCEMVGPDPALVGVSGGATVILAMLVGEGFSPRRALMHEPLLGRYAPALQRRMASAVTLSHRKTVDPVAFLRGLVGSDTWPTIPTEWVATALARPDSLLTEITAFASYEPGRLAWAFGTEVITTVGERSDLERHQAAQVLQEAGAVMAVIPDAGHLVQHDAPQAFARVVRTLTGADGAPR